MKKKSWFQMNLTEKAFAMNFIAELFVIYFIVK